MPFEYKKKTAPAARKGRSQPPIVSAKARPMAPELQRRFEDQIVELLANAVRERLIHKEDEQ